MAVHIRLRRIGKNPKGKPHFRVTVCDQHAGRDGRFVEEIGFYNPVSGETKVKMDRLDYWLKAGAQLSATVKSIAKKIRKEK